MKSSQADEEVFTKKNLIFGQIFSIHFMFVNFQFLFMESILSSEDIVFS